jgi:hypothetical protein
MKRIPGTLLFVLLCAVATPPAHAGARSIRSPRRLDLDLDEAPPACPCSDASLCTPVSTVYEKEVFGFTGNGAKDWRTFDFTSVTAIAWATDPQLICYAHKHGVRVIAAAPGGMPLSGNATVRAQVREEVERETDGEEGEREIERD